MNGTIFHMRLQRQKVAFDESSRCVVFIIHVRTDGLHIPDARFHRALATHANALTGIVHLHPFLFANCVIRKNFARASVGAIHQSNRKPMVQFKN
ncbi:hypothetical protein ACSFA3_16595 [Variovorax sp. RHLX14]|uniref:hypothetical protein n=1 Tax=Variovorax sp. RHLX14 TaxID=1259731 RepID=UPI003F459396